MVRKYVDVICLNDKAGNMKPLYLLWNEMKKIPVLGVKEICPRSSLKAGGSGLRYTCLFSYNRIRHLYYDRGKWYVEMQESVI
jgi:hypothetical protein